LRGAEVGNQTSDKREIGHKRSNVENHRAEASEAGRRSGELES
jgi:hypothetical protein